MVAFYLLREQNPVCMAKLTSMFEQGLLQTNSCWGLFANEWMLKSSEVFKKYFRSYRIHFHEWISSHEKRLLDSAPWSPPLSHISCSSLFLHAWAAQGSHQSLRSWLCLPSMQNCKPKWTSFIFKLCGLRCFAIATEN